MRQITNQIGGNIYCGNKPFMNGRPNGTKNQCYRKGIKSGYFAGSLNFPKNNNLVQKPINQLSNDFLKGVLKESGYRSYRNMSQNRLRDVFQDLGKSSLYVPKVNNIL